MTGLIVLLGPKHSGKTLAGGMLAETLCLPFYDLDRRIEEQTGKSPRTLYGEGETVFRAAETEALKSLPAETGVLALGGGFIDNPEAVSLLGRRQNAVLVCLETGAETAWERIAREALPPFLLNQKDPPETVHRLLHERRTKAYRELAGITVHAEGKSPETIAREIAALVQDENSS